MNASRRSDTGPFALVPEWVLDAEISANAKVLYGVLGRYADKEGEAWPRRRVLAARLRISERTLDRAMDELEDIGAVVTEARFGDDGQQSNLYRVRRAEPRVTSPLVTDDEDPLVTDGEQNESHSEREQSEPSVPSVMGVAARGPSQVDRVRVTDDEREKSIAVLAVWNDLAGQDLRSDEWLGKIIMRLREYPEATVEDHAFVIESSLRDPWWKGPPNPSVVYGNGMQFERSVQAARVRHEGGDDEIERIARILNRQEAEA